MKRKIGLLFALFSILTLMVFALTACGDSNNGGSQGSIEDKIDLSFKTLTVNGSEAYGEVSDFTEGFSFADEITTGGDTDFLVSLDPYGMEDVFTKTVPLGECENTFYIHATLNGKFVKTYKVIIHQEHSNSTAIGNLKVAYNKLDSTYEVTGVIDNTIEKIVVPHCVSGIGDNAFSKCNNLKSVTISDGVKSIGDEAFYYCTNLMNVTIPDSVTSIGDEAFSNCRSLSSATIGNGVTSIGDYAFFHCNKLMNATIGNGVTDIGDFAFAYCENLASITIPDSVITIGDYAFAYCEDLASITIPHSATSTGNFTFSDCKSLTRVVIEKGVKSIGNGAFGGCTGITNLSLPNSVTSIGSQAFTVCTSLTNITIPDCVTSIGNGAFASCTSLASINVSTNNASYKSINGNLYTKDGQTLVQYAPGKTETSFKVPKNVTSIGNGAFFSCISLTSITIPESVTSIGSNAFLGCNKLVEVIDHSSLNITAGSEDYGYAGYNAKVVHTGESKLVTYNDYLFYTFDEVNYLLGYVGKNKALTLPESYKGENYKLYNFAFCFRSNIVSVKIGNNVTNIGDYAFYDCASLTSVTIGSDVTAIGDEPFYGCHNLKSINVSEKNAVYKSIDGNLFTKDGQELLKYAPGKTENSFEIPNGTTSIAPRAFYDCESLTSVTIPDSFTSIGSSAFADCTSLKSITIPKSVTSFGFFAFYRCTSLETIKYRGTQNEWNKITKSEEFGLSWDTGTGSYVIEYNYTGE